MFSNFLNSIKNGDCITHNSNLVDTRKTLQNRFLLEYLKNDGSNSYILCSKTKNKKPFNQNKKENFEKYLADDKIVFIKDCANKFNFLGALTSKIEKNINHKTTTNIFSSTLKNGSKNLNFTNENGCIILCSSGLIEINISKNEKIYNYIVKQGDMIYVPKGHKYNIIFVTQSTIAAINFKKNAIVINDYKDVEHLAQNNNFVIHVVPYFDMIVDLTKKKKLYPHEIMKISGAYSMMRNPINCLNYMYLLDYKKANIKNYNIYSQKKAIDIDDDCFDYYSKDKKNTDKKTLLDEYLGTLLRQEYYDEALWLLEKNNLVGNWNYEKTDELYVNLNWPINSPEKGLIFVHLHIFTYLIEKYNIKNLYIQCNEQFKDFFSLYFPEIKVVNEKDVIHKIPQISIYKAFIDFHKQENSKKIILDQIQKNRKRVESKLNKKDNKIGLLWFSNDIISPHKSIPIGTFINTIGNNKKDLKLKSLQYNLTDVDIGLFNKYSKNKIQEQFHNNFHTPIIDIVHEVFDCKAVIGTSTVVLIAGAFGIPTLITAASPHFHWYLKENITPTIKTSRMKFFGDWETVYSDIYSFIDNHFD